MNNIYRCKNVIINEIKNLDYGDVLEFEINGDKQNVFFIKNTFFCLSEDSWKLSKKDFMSKYLKHALIKISFLEEIQKIFLLIK